MLSSQAVSSACAPTGRAPASGRQHTASCSPVPARGGQASTSAQDPPVPVRNSRAQPAAALLAAAQQSVRALRLGGAPCEPSARRHRARLEPDISLVAGTGQAAHAQRLLVALACWQALSPGQAGAAETVPLEFVKSWLVRSASCRPKVAERQPTHATCACRTRLTHSAQQARYSSWPPWPWQR